MLTDLVIGVPSDADGFVEPGSHLAAPHLQLKGLDNVKLGALLAALGHAEEGEDLEGERYLLKTVSDDGPWIFGLPDALRDGLAALGENTTSVVAKWLEHEEMKFEEWSADDVQSVLEMLRDFARLRHAFLSTQRGKAFYVEGIVGVDNVASRKTAEKVFASAGIPGIDSNSGQPILQFVRRIDGATDLRLS
jgi:hypothetical protein